MFAILRRAFIILSWLSFVQLQLKTLIVLGQALIECFELFVLSLQLFYPLSQNVHLCHFFNSSQMCTLSVLNSPDRIRKNEFSEKRAHYEEFLQADAWKLPENAQYLLPGSEIFDWIVKKVQSLDRLVQVLQFLALQGFHFLAHLYVNELVIDDFPTLFLLGWPILIDFGWRQALWIVDFAL